MDEKLRHIKIGDQVEYVNGETRLVATGQVVGWKWHGDHFLLVTGQSGERMVSLRSVFARNRLGCQPMTWPARLTSPIAVQ